MLVFLDAEFSDFTNADLISLALVSEHGQEFYAERTDYDSKRCTDFVRATVHPLLGRVPGASCTRSQCTERVRDWFQQLPESAIVIHDYAGDWVLLTKLVAGDPADDLAQPANFGENIELAVTKLIR